MNSSFSFWSLDRSACSSKVELVRYKGDRNFRIHFRIIKSIIQITAVIFH